MNLFDALVNLVDTLGESHRGTATGGSTTTLEDSSLPFRAGWFDGGTLLILTGDLAGKALTITSSTATVLTFASQAAAPAAGDLYAAVRGTYNRETLIASINRALSEIGDISQPDTSLVVDETIREYTLPAAAIEPVRVELTTDTASPYTWRRSFYWEAVNGSLIFDNYKEPTETGAPIRVWYNAPHAAVADETDTIASAIAPPRLAWTAAHLALVQRASIQTNDERLKEQITYANNQKMLMTVRYPLRNLLRDPHLANL